MKESLVNLRTQLTGSSKNKQNAIKNDQVKLCLSAIQQDDLDLVCLAFTNLILISSEFPQLLQTKQSFYEIFLTKSIELIHTQILRLAKPAFKILLSLHTQDLFMTDEVWLWALSQPSILKISSKLLLKSNTSQLNIPQILNLMASILTKTDMYLYTQQLLPPLTLIYKLLPQSEALFTHFQLIFQLSRLPISSIKVKTGLIIAYLYEKEQVPQQQKYKLNWVFLNSSSCLQQKKYLKRVLTIISKLTLNNQALQQISRRTKIFEQIIHKVLSDFNQMASNNQIDQDEFFSGLEALSSICQQHEVNRQILLEKQQFLKMIYQLVKDQRYPFKKVAWQCIFHLSRSVKRIKCSVLHHQIGLSFDELLDCEVQIQELIISTLANALIDLPWQSLLEIVKRLIEFLNSQIQSLKFKALFSIKNIIYKAESYLKNIIMDHITYQKLLELSNQTNYQIQEQSLIIFRNLLLPDQIQIQKVLTQVGSELLDLLSQKLQSPVSSVAAHALYTIANISSGNSGHKNRIIQSLLFQQVLRSLSSESKQERNGACLVLINLCQPTGEDSDQSRILFLINHGVREKLEAAKHESPMEVLEYLQDALEKLNTTS